MLILDALMSKLQTQGEYPGLQFANTFGVIRSSKSSVERSFDLLAVKMDQYQTLSLLRSP